MKGKDGHIEEVSTGTAVVRIILVIVAALFITRAFVLDFAIVQGRSMLPGLESSDLVLVFKAAYGIRNPRGGYFFRWGSPREGELVAALRPDITTLVIKRVGRIVPSQDRELSGTKGDLYFLMGDNKYESLDSRDYGPVPMNNIVGRALPLPGL